MLKVKRECHFEGIHNKHKEWGCLIFDWLGRPVTRFLAKYTNITPNQVSILSFILCVIGAYFLFLGGYKNVLIGASFAFIGNLFDMVDGCLARATGLRSIYGHWLDAMIDFIVFPLLVFALAVGIGTYPAMFLGMLAIISYPNHYLIIHFYNAAIVKKHEPMAIPGNRRWEWLRDVYGSNLFYLFLFIGAVFDLPLYVLLFWATFGNLYWMGIILMQYLALKKQAGKQ